MVPNPFDQASRYAAKLDPLGFLRWLIGRLAATLVFAGWLDTRTIPFPGEPDRTCDTVACLLDPAAPEVPWAMPVEFQGRPQNHQFGRLLEYLARLWVELRPPGQPTGRYQVVAGVVNLTGVGRTSRDMQLGQTGLRTCLQVAERNLAEEEAAATLDGIAAGDTARCILVWIPLMRGGGEAAIIERWKELARAEPDGRRRSDYAGLALVFAELAGCWAPRKEALEGWNVEQSLQVLEWQAQAEKRGRAEGRAEGIIEAKIDALIRILATRFPPGPPAELAAQIQNTHDVALLDQWLNAALVTGSLADFQRLVQG